MHLTDWRTPFLSHPNHSIVTQHIRPEVYTTDIKSKAQRQMEFSEFFIFVSFRIVPFSKFRNFSGKPGFSEFAKILQKKFGNKFGSKPLFLRQKQGFWGQKQGFPNNPNLWNIQNLLYSKFSENYEKMMSNLNFYFCKKLVPTWIFEFEFGMFVCVCVCVCSL